jgi:hypothetical protein
MNELEKAIKILGKQTQVVVPFSLTKREIKDYTVSGDFPDSQEEAEDGVWEYFHLATKQFPGVEVGEIRSKDVKRGRFSFYVSLSGEENVLRDFLKDVLAMSDQEIDALEKE